MRQPGLLHLFEQMGEIAADRQLFRSTFEQQGNASSLCAGGLHDFFGVDQGGATDEPETLLIESAEQFLDGGPDQKFAICSFDGRVFFIGLKIADFVHRDQTHAVANAGPYPLQRRAVGCQFGI